MLLIAICNFSPEVAYFVLLTFPCTQNVCHRHLPMPSQLILCRQKHRGEYKKAKVKPLEENDSKKKQLGEFYWQNSKILG